MAFSYRCKFRGLTAPPCSNCTWHIADLDRCQLNGFFGNEKIGSNFSVSCEDARADYERERNELLKHVVGAIGVIKAQFDAEVIRNYEIPPLVNTKTGEDIGFGVKMQLSTRYDYDEELLTEWKRLLKADDWYISVKWNKLHVTFKVRYKED